jgi:hypothetical protein
VTTDSQMIVIFGSRNQESRHERSVSAGDGVACCCAPHIMHVGVVVSSYEGESGGASQAEFAKAGCSKGAQHRILSA